MKLASWRLGVAGVGRRPFLDDDAGLRTHRELPLHVQAAHMQIAEDLRVAELHWGAAPAPCVGAAGEPVPVHLALFNHPDPSVSAHADQPGCRIWLDRDHWPGPPSRRRCVEIAHEWGHLLGHSHTTHGLMSEEASGVVPGCDRFGAQRRRPARETPLRPTPRLVTLLRRFLRGPT
jgi:hypothetical protein